MTTEYRHIHLGEEVAVPRPTGFDSEGWLQDRAGAGCHADFSDRNHAKYIPVGYAEEQQTLSLDQTLEVLRGWVKRPRVLKTLKFEHFRTGHTFVVELFTMTEQRWVIEQHFPNEDGAPKTSRDLPTLPLIWTIKLDLQERLTPFDTKTRSHITPLEGTRRVQLCPKCVGAGGSCQLCQGTRSTVSQLCIKTQWHTVIQQRVLYGDPDLPLHFGRGQSDGDKGAGNPIDMDMQLDGRADVGVQSITHCVPLQIGEEEGATLDSKTDVNMRVNQAVNNVVNDLLQQQRNRQIVSDSNSSPSNIAIIRQRIAINLVPVMMMNYDHDTMQHDVVVYGVDHRVLAPEFPQEPSTLRKWVAIGSTIALVAIVGTALGVALS